jgi:predicted ATPase with chaperone activity
MTEETTIPAPQTVDELGILRSSLEQLALKLLFLASELTLDKLARQLRLRLDVVNEVFQSLRKAELCEVKGVVGGVYRIAITQQGKTRALEALALNQYTGPAPISLKDYVTRVRAQSVTNFPATQALVEQAFSHLVLSNRILKQLGSAVVSGTSIFLYGPTGTGKTSIAEAIPSIYNDRIWIPYAVEVDSQIITVFDPIIHKVAEGPEGSDGRWVPCRRPRVIVGGELSIEMLDLQFHPVSKFYAAPLQMKANNGALIVDDFGRQRIRPEELLNRWTIPLDRRVDFLTLLGGKKLEIPFDAFVVFSTNLDPAKLADDAFLRRIQNKIKIDNLDRDEFRHVFERLSKRLDLKFEPNLVDYLEDLVTTEWKQPLRPCLPRDLVNHVLWTAQFEGETPRLDQETLAEACRAYFLGP